jgi:hypothetical protein
MHSYNSIVLYHNINFNEGASSAPLNPSVHYICPLSRIAILLQQPRSQEHLKGT